MTTCPTCRANAQGDLPIECERRDCPGNSVAVPGVQIVPLIKPMAKESAA